MKTRTWKGAGLAAFLGLIGIGVLFVQSGVSGAPTARIEPASLRAAPSLPTAPSRVGSVPPDASEPAPQAVETREPEEAPQESARDTELAEAAALVNRLVSSSLGAYPRMPADLRAQVLTFFRGSPTAARAFFDAMRDVARKNALSGRMLALIRSVPEPERAAYQAEYEAALPSTQATIRLAAESKNLSDLLTRLETATEEAKCEALLYLPGDTLRHPTLADLMVRLARADESNVVRSRALNALALTGSERLVPLAIDICRDAARPSVDHNVAANAIMRGQFSPETLPQIDELLSIYHDLDIDSRAGMVKLLVYRSNNPTVQDAVLELLGGKGVPRLVRLAAADAAGQLLRTLQGDEAAHFAARTAQTVLELDDRGRAPIVISLVDLAFRSAPLKDAVAEMRRTAPAGGEVEAIFQSHSPIVDLLFGGL